MPISGGVDFRERCLALGHPYQFYTGHDIDYFEVRHIWLDGRVPEMLKISPASMWSFEDMVICLSHNTNPHRRGELLSYPVKVDDNAFIAMRVILFNCHIGEGAVVGAGSVVASMTVPPYTMVVGNPARIIKRWSFDANAWITIRKARLEDEPVDWAKELLDYGGGHSEIEKDEG